MSQAKPKLTPVGTVTKRAYTVRVCRECHYAIGESGLCSDDCRFDGNHRPRGGVILRRYESVDTLVGEDAE